MGKYRGLKNPSAPHRLGKYLMHSNKAVKYKLHTKHRLTRVKLSYSVFIKKGQEIFGMLQCTLN